MSIRVMLVDDHKLLREGLKQLLEFDTEIEVVYQAASGEECLNMLAKNQPDVMLLDINFNGMSGLKVLREVKRHYKKIKVIILTVHNEVDYVMEALDEGADGYMLKDTGSGDLAKAIKGVFKGDRYIQPELVPVLNSRLVQKSVEEDKMKEITKRERQILISIASGKSNQQIAEEFNISERTVKNHITNLFKKIDVKDRTQAAVFAIRNNIVSI